MPTVKRKLRCSNAQIHSEFESVATAVQWCFQTWSNIMKDYFSFSGKTSRSSYWKFQLVYFGLFIVAGAIFGVFTALLVPDGQSDPLKSLYALSSPVKAVLLFWVLPTYVISVWLSLAVTVRRLRDIGISPWWSLTTCIPYLAFVAIPVFGCIPSKNK